eukprot:7717490-Pyramimonas_sp.AAC.1
MEKQGASDNSPSEPRGGKSETPNRAAEYGVQLVVKREGGSQSRKLNCPRYSRTRSTQTEEK